VLADIVAGVEEEHVRHERDVAHLPSMYNTTHCCDRLRQIGESCAWLVRKGWLMRTKAEDPSLTTDDNLVGSSYIVIGDTRISKIDFGF
jgi:hypothetical protein